MSLGNPCPLGEVTNHCPRRARGGNFGKSAPQPQPQKPANPPPRPGAHPTAKTPKKPASQRQGSFAQWAKEQPPPGTPGTPGTPGKNGGYRPGGPGMGDEPRAKSNSYQSGKKADAPPFSNGAQDSWESDSDNVESILKSRPRQPYQKVYGERTKLFDERNGGEGEGRGRKPFKDAGSAPTTPKKGGNSAGSYMFGFCLIMELMPNRVTIVLAPPRVYARTYANVSTLARTPFESSLEIRQGCPWRCRRRFYSTGIHA